MSRVLVLFALLLLLPVTVVAAVYLGLFQPRTIYQTGLHPLDVADGDLDEDGNIDIVTANRDGMSLSVFMGNGDGSLTRLEDMPIGYGATSLALAFFDADHYLDVVVSACNKGCSDNGVIIGLGRGDGSFKLSGFIEVEGVPYNLAVDDFNQDGHMDIAASDYPNARINLMLGTETEGAFDILHLPAGPKTIALLAADFDGDGLRDLITSNHGEGASTLYLLNKDPSLAERIVIPTGELPYAIDAAYFNQDDTLDLVVAHSSKPGKISVLHGRGMGDFERVQELEHGDRLVFIDAADVNRDGFSDVIVTQHRERFATVYFNDGEGLLRPDAEDVDSENRIYSLVVTELNNDGYPDLVAVDYKANTLSVSLGEFRNP